MNKTDKAKLAEDYHVLNQYASQLSNFAYNIVQQDKRHEHLADTVRKFDEARHVFRETLKRHSIINEEVCR